MRLESQKYLNQLVLQLRLEGLGSRYIIGTGLAADNILAHAASSQADMVAMTTHAPENLRRLIWGSVTDRVVRAGEFPVLVTKVDTQKGALINQ
jgi:nucleotide-binding universal stress UspA family protein